MNHREVKLAGNLKLNYLGKVAVIVGPYPDAGLTLRYSVCRSGPMERTLSNWPRTSFLVGWKGLMHVLGITLHCEVSIEAR